MYCELCMRFKDVQLAHIILDNGEPFDGNVCSDCREGREVCQECEMLLPNHKEHCIVMVGC